MSNAAAVEPNLNQLRQSLEQAGYRVKTVADPIAEMPHLRSVRGARSADGSTGDRPFGVRPLSRGCAASLQLGDRITVGPGGTTCLTVRGSLRISGEDDRLAGTVCWQIRKSFRRRGRSELSELTIEADLILGAGVAPADIVNHGRDIYRHLRLLIDDARDTLRDRRISARAVPAAVLRIEAKSVGALAIGRCGLVAPDEADVPVHPSLTILACGRLRDEILPDLARVLRDMIRRAADPRSQVRAVELGGEAPIAPEMQAVQ